MTSKVRRHVFSFLPEKVQKWLTSNFRGYFPRFGSTGMAEWYSDWRPSLIAVGGNGRVVPIDTNYHGHARTTTDIHELQRTYTNYHGHARTTTNIHEVARTYTKYREHIRSTKAMHELPRTYTNYEYLHVHRSGRKVNII
jgi:hypothetical protein